MQRLPRLPKKRAHARGSAFDATNETKHMHVPPNTASTEPLARKHRSIAPHPVWRTARAAPAMAPVVSSICRRLSSSRRLLYSAIWLDRGGGVRVRTRVRAQGHALLRNGPPIPEEVDTEWSTRGFHRSGRQSAERQVSGCLCSAIHAKGEPASHYGLFATSRVFA